MEARLSPAPSLPSDAEQYDSVPQSATPSQQLRGRLDAEAAPFLPQRGAAGRGRAIELRCGSHVARLLRKLPKISVPPSAAISTRRDGVPSLMDFAEWLEYELLTKEQKATWVKSNNRCWRCGRHHQAAQCRLKVLCKTCKGKHLEALHDVNLRAAKREVAAGAEVKSSTDALYLDRRAGCNQVLLKDAAKRLQLQGTPESLILRTVREDRRELHGSSVTFKISPAGQPTKTFTATNAFTAGPVKSLQQYSHQQQCLFLATTSQAAELFKQVEKLWQLDTLPYRSERLVTRSRRDEEATNLLEAKTTRVEVEGVLRYATPLLRVSNMPTLTAPPEAALSTLRGTEKRLSRDPVKAEAYRAEIMKLEKTGYATRTGAKEVIDKLRGLLMEGGFELRQWASNIPDVISHLPKEIRVLASQYDPIGFLTPFTTRAKVLVQQLWDKKREWDDPCCLVTCSQRESLGRRVATLDDIRLPRCYVSLALDHAASKREVHIFCDASQWAYGSVGYLRTEDAAGHVELANLLIRELTLEVSRVVMWTDSTTVLAWIQSDSCRFKVFVGTRIAEIQELTDSQAWRYVETSENPADDLTRGKTLQDLIGENRWTQGPHSCGFHLTNGQHTQLQRQFSSFSELVKATARHLHGAAADEEETYGRKFKEAELSILRSAQRDSFPEEVRCLAAGKPVPSSSCLITLAPEYDVSLQLIRVGGCLRRCQELEPDVIHPVVLDPRHVVTKLLIRQVDSDLKHPGAERLFAELRRKF
ncbi:hypothetical protein AAFF_G00404380 [Aldrovandia affinis]|uniref:Uncharacterized protein n=1 Tax=Aldrovandia affinis TaxID=143900 RepID=A0AAD7T947_9TELE|nr:hypothetical protein AAFF_G00404380 [Aldrovandia affinis]